MVVLKFVLVVFIYNSNCEKKGNLGGHKPLRGMKLFIIYTRYSWVDDKKFFKNFK